MEIFYNYALIPWRSLTINSVIAERKEATGNLFVGYRPISFLGPTVKPGLLAIRAGPSRDRHPAWHDAFPRDAE
jgi:hypothetical protein